MKWKVKSNEFKVVGRKYKVIVIQPIYVILNPDFRSGQACFRISLSSYWL
jgi:hypothetical protein